MEWYIEDVEAVKNTISTVTTYRKFVAATHRPQCM
jgi:hypothetical protein